MLSENRLYDKHLNFVDLCVHSIGIILLLRDLKLIESNRLYDIIIWFKINSFGPLSMVSHHETVSIEHAFK